MAVALHCNCSPRLRHLLSLAAVPDRSHSTASDQERKLLPVQSELQTKIRLGG